MKKCSFCAEKIQDEAIKCRFCGESLLSPKGKKALKEMNDTLLTVEDVAVILKIRPNTIHSRVWQRRTGCPLKRVGKRCYVETDQFWSWFRSL